MVAVDVETGKVKWRRNLPDVTRGAPVVWLDRVFVACADSYVYALNNRNGKGRG